MDGPASGNLLSLKVMRLSRPTIAKAWQPFYSSSPSFSSHSTASVLSLQGKAPLPGHPKTLRDLTHATELLTLPSSFGSIQLGETFTSCLCVNNEASVDIYGVSMKVEMQTATSKVLLSDFGGQDCRLAVGETMENMVNHEMKELGQHVLACTVSYRLPQSSRVAATVEVGPDAELQTFRKFYKFAVTNPLSVKTKVHTPRSPSALFSAAEMHKIFLEVHIQNLTQESMWFERMQFQCAEGWKVEDGNVFVAGEGEKENVFSGSISLMQPQDTRQYIYILQPTTPPISPVVYEPGSTIPLGRLDLSWRSAFGEPGRLLTSMLSRRIPLPPPLTQQPASALPPHLKRTPTPSSVPSRPHSPQSTHTRPGTPPPIHRPGSPFRSRPPAGTTRPQSPALPAPIPRRATAPVPAPIQVEPSDVQVNLIVRNIPRESIAIEKPFNISCSLIVSVPEPSSRPAGGAKQQRVLSLVVQHIQSPQLVSPSPKLAQIPDVFSPRVPQSAREKVLASPRRQDVEDGFFLGVSGLDSPILPPPFATEAEGSKPPGPLGVVFLGLSTVWLESIRLSERDQNHAGTEGDDGTTRTVVVKDEQGSQGTRKVQIVREFELTYLPVCRGFLTVGGLRVLLVEDKMVNDDGVVSEEISGSDQATLKPAEARILEEWDVIGEIWVKS